MHSGMYAYRDRRDRKAQFRRLWITRINAALAPARHVVLAVHERAEGRRASRSTARSWPTWRSTIRPRSPRSSSRRRPPRPRPRLDRSAGPRADVRQEPQGRERRPAAQARVPRARSSRSWSRARRRSPRRSRPGTLETLFTADDARPGRGERAARRRRDPSRRRRRRAPPHLDGHAAGPRRRRRVPRRGTRSRRSRASFDGGARGLCRAAARGPRPGQRGHGAALGRRGRRGRRRVLRDVGRRLQPQDGACLGRVGVPPAGRARRRDARGDRATPRPRAPACSRWRPTARTICTGPDLSGSVAFVFGNEAHGLPRGDRRCGRRVAFACRSRAGRSR